MRTVWTRVFAGLTLVAVAAALGCGGGGGNEDKEKQVAEKACPTPPAAMSGTPSLPTGFPQPAEVTYTGQVAKGPTSVVKGYFAGDIDEAYNTYKDSFKDPFEVEGSEHEAIDAEIEFKGSDKEGQVKLLQTCKERTRVTITVRPQ
jgi:hypothetical protein